MSDFNLKSQYNVFLILRETLIPILYIRVYLCQTGMVASRQECAPE